MESWLCVETRCAVSAESNHSPPVEQASRVRRLFSDGVLPEGLGLCFVVLVFGGFAIAYFVSEHSWKQQARAAQQAEAAALAQVLAATLGAAADTDGVVPEPLLQGLSRQPCIRAVRWATPDGQVRFAWPPAIVAAAGKAGGEAHTTLASAPILTPDGTSLGTLQLEARLTRSTGRSHLLWNWGVAAGITLIVFAAAYHRLRRHLRPVAAIERNLKSYADGLEKELVTLTLSESLGSVARGWNLLIEQLAEAQKQLQNTRPVGGGQDVLARFEGAIFRRIVDRLPFGVLCVGEQQTIRYCNAAAAALLGHPRDKVVGMPAGEAIDDPAVAQALVGAQVRHGAGLMVDQTYREDDQETTLRFRILALTEHSTNGDVLITLEDIGALREGQRARDNFLYHVTHELRTPLTNIHAYAETLTKPGFDDEQTRKECYNVIISETRRLSSLVENILSISQLEVGSARLDVGEVDLQRLIRQMVQDNLGAADEKRIDLTLTLPPKVPKIRGDKQRLSVLLNNLIGNAVKYTPEGGQVQVQLEIVEQCVRILVGDNGIGIASEDQQHVFDKFYRAAADAVQEVTGTGLGLAIAREVARLHGGEIHLESEPGQGSTFTIELPLPTAEHAEVST